jgi:hypothetical protein
MAIATLIVPILASAAPKLIELIKEWNDRDKGRETRLTVKQGDLEISIVSYDSERTPTIDVAQVVELLRRS